VSKPSSKQELAALGWLYAAQLFGVKLGLESTCKLLGVLDVPTDGQKFIHVAGTNGKGSVSAFCHSLLKAAEVNAGLFTSPHLIHFRERIKDAERCISSAEIVSGVATLQKITEGWVPSPTFFELTFALAMDWFRKRKREWVVLETGMGGRLDATNTVTPAVSIITSISLDHQLMLGQTLREIATEKAGIIKPGVPVVTIRQIPEAMDVISQTARDRGAPLIIVTTPLRGYQLGLFGQHQMWNAALALAALKAAGFKLAENILRDGLKNVDWPARFQRFAQDRIILDGAHNPDAAQTLVRTWHAAFPGEKASIVFGGVATKDVLSTVRALQPIAAHWHLTGFQSPRSVPPAEVKNLLKSIYGDSVHSHTHKTIEEALAAAKGDKERILVTGSLYLAGEMLAHLRGEKELFQASAQ
jgi:dihydrofolate synthase/folylpolyglutamate synthase